VGPRAGLDAIVKKKIPSPYRDSNPHPNRSPALYHNVKMYIKKVGFDDVKWVHVTQDTVQWRAIVNTIIKDEDFTLAERRLASQEGLCSM